MILDAGYYYYYYFELCQREISVTR